MARRYKASEYALALLVTAGCTVFLMAGPTSSRHARAAAEGPAGVGTILLPVRMPLEHAAHTIHRPAIMPA